MRDKTQTIRTFLCSLAGLTAAMLPACDALDPAAQSLLVDAVNQPTSDDPERVTVILHNVGDASALVDMALDDFLVTYPVTPGQILTIRLKCADVFTFAAMQFPDADIEDLIITVDQPAVRGLDYDCGDILLINIDPAEPELKVVSVD